MLRHTMFSDFMPLATFPQPIDSLDPQECFNKSLNKLYALKTPDKAEKDTYAELRHLRDAYSLTDSEMITSLPNFHKNLIS